MKIVEAIRDWSVSTINGLITQLGLPVTIYAQIGVIIAAGLLIILALAVVNEILFFFRYRRDREKREALEAIPPKMTINEKAVFRNGMTVAWQYPVILRLLNPDVEDEEDGETLGYIIRPSHDGDNFLFFEGEWSRLSVIQSLHHLLIEGVEKQIEDGVKRDKKDEKGNDVKDEKGNTIKEQIAPPGCFDWNGAIWEIERTLLFAVLVMNGEISAFPDKNGAIELICAIPYKEEEQENGAVILEHQFNPSRRRVDETQMGYYVSETTEVKVRADIGDLLETLDLSS